MADDTQQDRMLRAMMPEHQAAPPARWQQRKSAQTRQRLIDAGVACLVEGGYSRLTTAGVAERCAISRGTMHHHFPTRADLVAAVVEFVFYDRMRRFLNDYYTMLAERGEELLVEVACEAHWQSVQSREYLAYLELAVAARTDPELSALFTPAARLYDEVWTREMIEAFPQWQRHWDDLKKASDFTQAVHMGMLLHQPMFGEGERLEHLRRLTSQVVRSLYEN